MVIIHHRDRGLEVTVEYQVLSNISLWTKQGITVPLNQWFHLVVVWSFDRDMALYLNEDPVITVKGHEIPNPLILYTSSIRLGNVTNGHDAALMDELQIWFRALDQDYVKTTFSSGE